MSEFFRILLYVYIAEDRYTPVPVANKELVVIEGGKSTLTTEYLSFTDDDTEPASLSYLILQPPKLGYIQLSNKPGLFIALGILALQKAALPGGVPVFCSPVPQNENLDFLCSPELPFFHCSPHF